MANSGDPSTNADAAWHILGPGQQVQPPSQIRPAAADRGGALRFVCISDTHGKHRELDGLVPDGDVLVHAGDFTNTGETDQVQDLHDWLCELPHRWKVVIAGNHDLTMDAEHYELRGRDRFHGGQGYDPASTRRILQESESVIYLEDSVCAIPINNDGHSIQVYGSPHQPEFCDWAFNLPRGEPTLQKAKQIPTETNVLITHGPPLGRGDMCMPSHNRAGCIDLLSEVQQRVQPAVHVFGHIHEGYGVTTDGTTAFVNASTCTLRYKPCNPAIVFDLDVAEDGTVLPPVFVEFEYDNAISGEQVQPP
jgi:Icc-related predicted phosphoesterase